MTSAFGIDHGDEVSKAFKKVKGKTARKGFSTFNEKEKDKVTKSAFGVDSEIEKFSMPKIAGMKAAAGTALPKLKPMGTKLAQAPMAATSATGKTGAGLMNRGAANIKRGGAMGGAMGGARKTLGRAQGAVGGAMTANPGMGAVAGVGAIGGAGAYARGRRQPTR